jgi:DNA-directed RNA polymerase subunit M/transcription elongation factor TFIIS
MDDLVLGFIEMYELEIINARQLTSLTNLQEVITQVETIDRRTGLNRIEEHLPVHLAYKVEKGILEFTIGKVITSELPLEFLTYIYNDKINSVSENLDSSGRLHNVEFKKGLLEERINPFFVAFLRPDQVYPERWKEILDRKQTTEKEKESVIVSDLYKCYKCGNRKVKIHQVQTRSADEPSTTFVTCVVCYNTFTK